MVIRFPFKIFLLSFVFTQSILMLLVLTFPVNCFALSPLQQTNDLVAGEGDPGFEDGVFYAAQFNKPEGLALNDDGSILYVADQDNNRIRAVDLNNRNQVQTISGTGKAGNLNGPISVATYNQPNCLAVLPDGQIVVGEKNGTKGYSLRLIDLKSGMVTTLAGDGVTKTDSQGPEVRLSKIWNMGYRSSDRCLYFSEPQEGAVKRYNFQTSSVETVIQNQPLIPHPKALCVNNDKVYVADGLLPQVYSLEGLENLMVPAKPVTTMTVGMTPVITPIATSTKIQNDVVRLQLVGTAQSIIALAGSKTRLYAYEGLQAPPTPSPIVCLTTPSHPLTFVSVWGYPLANASRVMPYFKGLDGNDPVGFIPDKRSEGRFFITNPANHLIAAFRDLDFASQMANCGTFNYPINKPFRTFRILVVGRSYPCLQVNSLYDDKGNDSSTENTMTTFPNKLELELNTQAAWDDVPIHFEVMTEHAVASVPIWSWPYYGVPNYKAYDIDLVLITVDPSQSNLEDF